MPRKTLSLLGFILVLSQISGIPNQWKTIYAVVVGVILIILSVKKFYKSSSEVILEEMPVSNFKSVMTESEGQSYGEHTQKGQ